ncbi:MAG TPA: DUF1761 domain-containing protein [Acidobacteriota bacterium]|nr:DUF1761 domain-containing protein [Acidobacteriota bacterium]
MIKHNHIAIVVAVILHQAIGFLWYSPYLFVNQWTAGLGIKPSDLDLANPAAFFADIVGWFFASYFISWLVQRTELSSFHQGLGMAVLLWVGVVLPLLAPHYLFAGLHVNVLLIDAMNGLVQLALTCGLLTLWRKR